MKNFRLDNRVAYPDWHNAPVPSFGQPRARLVIIGLAPGLSGANRTGRPFTGDGAGDLLFSTMLELRLAKGNYKRDGKDNLMLLGCRIVNVLRCVPPENIPTREEILACRDFFKSDIEHSRAHVFLALGQVAHRAMLDLFELRPYSHFQFRHGGEHRLAQGKTLIDSYHCSRRNTSSGLLTKDMFRNVLQRAQTLSTTSKQNN